MLFCFRVVLLLLRVLRSACFFFSFAEKKRNKRKPPEKKASVFSGWCYCGRQCYCAAGQIGSGGLCYCGNVMPGVLRKKKPLCDAVALVIEEIRYAIEL